MFPTSADTTFTYVPTTIHASTSTCATTTAFHCSLSFAVIGKVDVTVTLTEVSITVLTCIYIFKCLFIEQLIFIYCTAKTFSKLIMYVLHLIGVVYLLMFSIYGILQSYAIQK